MHSSIAYERVRNGPNGEVGHSLVPPPSEPTGDLHASNDRRSLSQHDQQTASILTGSGLDAEELQAGLEMSSIRSMSVDSLQLTPSDGTGSAGSIHRNEQPGELGQATLTQYGEEPTVASHNQGRTESTGPRLLPRTTIQRDLPWCLAWLFDVVLTMIPLHFLGMTAVHFILFLPTPPD